MDPDDAVPYNEFVDLARDHGLIAIDVQVLQTPGETNGRTAVVQATARTAQGGFGAIGEASPLSAPPAWHPFLTTLAELRAKARALRELTGADHAVREELATPYAPDGLSGDGDAMPEAGLPEMITAQRSTPSNGALSCPTPAATIGRPESASASSRPVPPARASVGAANVGPDHDENIDDEDIGDEDGDEKVTAGAKNGARPAATAPAAPRQAAADDELPPDFEGIGRDMEAKLLKLAMSIAAAEGDDISEAEAREKLNAFFLKAFKHPLNRATRIEGQRVVQRLSGDLSRLRTGRVTSDE